MTRATRAICSIFRRKPTPTPAPALTPEEIAAHQRIHAWAARNGISVSINQVKPATRSTSEMLTRSELEQLKRKSKEQHDYARKVFGTKTV
ncbi:hypothetical protein GE300_00405 [Rhodobacteraceae bacterium 2CG4]|uniref:Uncharacterized protein n=1 Tax=Halovulum marinum TaxID=2662447 RepID=A0A6L5YWP8_9RHOB|nr:hypothetical protein [Halovulum marinum]MSU88074.1 hypothetical protein [Halovulum marinum]